MLVVVRSRNQKAEYHNTLFSSSIRFRGHNASGRYLGPRSKIYETSIAPGAGAALDVIFPEEGTYFGNDHDIGHLLIGGGFVVIASSKSMVEG
jgi:hypothetical protein